MKMVFFYKNVKLKGGVIVYRCINEGLQPTYLRPVRLFQKLPDITGIIPGNEVILIPEMPVKRSNGITAVFCDIPHRKQSA